jgi:RES domain-containing protein
MSFEAVVFRATAFYEPLWGFPNTTGGRYNVAGRFPAQYLSLHPMTPWAELMRNLNRRTPEQARAMRVPVWAFRIGLADDPEPITFDTMGAYGLDPDDLVADDQTATRALGTALYDGGVTSLLAPSAALPGTTNLVVLRPAAITDFHAEPIDALDWPAAMVTQDGRCPEDLWEHVHYRNSGVPHAALQAWRDGDEFEFEQPEVTAASLMAA